MFRLRDVSSVEPEFRNRKRELDDVVDGLANQDRTRFWLVVAPPQLGKSWFLNRVGAELANTGWIVRAVDVGGPDAAAPEGSESLLRKAFEPEVRPGESLDTSKLAGALLDKERYFLLLIDGAESLDRTTIEGLRRQLSEINDYIEGARSTRTRLAVVVASRNDQSWLGAGPGPAPMLRLKALPLTEFKVEIVFEKLREVADQVGHDYRVPELRDQAELVHGLSEGLPALLRSYVERISDTRFAQMARLADQDSFEQLAAPYIRAELLSAGSLLGCCEAKADPAVLAALEEATRVLSPYRRITQSHVSHYVRNGALEQVAAAAGLSVDQLWSAFSGMALLYRPNNEPWKVLHAPIRRLLYRHWHPSPTARAQAQAQACAFLRGFNDLAGRDQTDFLIERLWHETQSLTFGRAPNFEAEVVGLAATLSESIRRNSSYTQGELRDYMANRLNEDDEIMKVVQGYDGLFERLVEAVRNPRLGAGS